MRGFACDARAAAHGRHSARGVQWRPQHAYMSLRTFKRLRAVLRQAARGLLLHAPHPVSDTPALMTGCAASGSRNSGCR